jgi:alpha-L-rhamnosidase
VADGWYSGYVGFGLLTGIGTEKIGRYSYGKTPALMAQLEIEYADGRRQIVPTDTSWKTTGEGPIKEADFLMGEYYDARRETAGWTQPGFADQGWEPAIRAQDNGSVKATFYEHVNPATGPDTKIEGREVELGFQRPAKLEAFPGLPVRVIEEIATQEITSPTNGVYIFNLGQNFAGIVRLKVKGPAGTVIQLRYGEMLHPDGRLMTENLRKARAIDHYVLRGDPKGETYVPRFTFHGFQYVELSGFPGKPGKEAITGLVLHSDTPMSSDFTCSDPVVNRLFKNIVWTQRANFLDLPTDCPQRDERFGWTGDAQIYVRAATYNADVAAFYTKWLRELMESQRPSGTFPGYAPYPFQHGWDFGTAWCDAGVICPYAIYQAYGDTRIIERCWAPMVRFLEWRKSTAKDFLGIVHGNNWGDWLAMGETTPIDYIDTAYFAYSTSLMAEMGSAIAKNREAAEYRSLLRDIKAAFNRKYVKADGSLAVDTQTAYALALWMDLLPENLRPAAGRILAQKITAKADAKNSGITTGFLGTRPLLPVLSATDNHDLAVALLQSRKFPSWGFEVENGATTIWERWNSYTRENGFGGEQNASMNSFSHYSFGAVCEWMFGTLAGLKPLEPGWHRFAIEPRPPSSALRLDAPAKPMDWVRAHYDSPRGRIESEWRQTAYRFELRVAVPANTTALVTVPRAHGAELLANGKPMTKNLSLRLVRTGRDQVVIEVPSGRYTFSSRR